MLESDKIMFEIYKESAYSERYHVVYFTELDDHDKDKEIDRALAGEHFYDGFIRNERSEEAKEVLESIIERLNDGDEVEVNELNRLLDNFLA